MHEIIVNLHMHTVYSDGSGTHKDIADAAIKAGLDAVIVTDHNVYVHGIEGYFGSDRKVLLLIGEEVHDQTRQPQKNHLLVFGAGRQMAGYAPDPQGLIDAVNDAGGISFLAHPFDLSAPLFGETDITWEDWDVQNYTGVELWNGLSELKFYLTNYFNALFYGLNFKYLGHGPPTAMLNKWDELLSTGRQIVAVGGSDAHRMKKILGPIHRWIYPYEDHFQAVNTHVLLTSPLSGEVAADKKLIYAALRAGHCFVGYDLPESTKGFRFTAHCESGINIMGDVVNAKESITLQIKLPTPTEFHLLKDGQRIRSSMKRDNLIHKVEEPGVYRVEAFKSYKDKRRGWIYSNPIYVKD